jgi:hypothetical protein
MDYFIQLLVSGIAAGLVYGFIGMGFAMIYRATGVVNFAQGELMMLVAYIAFTLAGTFKLGFWPLLLATVVVSVALGLLVEVLLIRPMLGQPVFSTVMVTIGLAVIIRSVVVLIWGADPMPLSTGLSTEPIRIGPAGVYPAQLLRTGHHGRGGGRALGLLPLFAGGHRDACHRQPADRGLADGHQRQAHLRAVVGAVRRPGRHRRGPGGRHLRSRAGHVAGRPAQLPGGHPRRPGLGVRCGAWAAS